MNLWAIGVVRNEADIVRTTVLHHHAQGVSHFLWLDDGSTDGTQTVLDALRSIVSLEWRPRAGAFRQDALLTSLAQEAFVRGADWILPLDADEFWYAPGSSLRDVLQRSSAGALRAEVVNFVQRREQRIRTPRGLLTMTRRADPVGAFNDAEALVESGRAAYVEIRYPGKLILRACPSIETWWGNHDVFGLQGPLVDTCDIHCLHAPLRSRDDLDRKADDARADQDVEEYLAQAWHIRRWRRRRSAWRRDAEWRANSYDESGALDLFGEPRATVEDTRLADLVAPWVGDVPAPGTSVPAPNPDNTPVASESPALDDQRQPEAWQRLVAIVDALRERARESRARETALKYQVDRHGQLAARGTSDATQARAVADAMRDELAQARAEISNLRTAPPRSEQELTRERPPARSEYDERARAEIEALRAELQAAQARVDDLLASASWRTMAPLRAAYDLLHRVVARSTGDRSRPGEARQAPTLAPNQLPTDEPPVGTAHQEMSAPHSLLVIAPALPTPDRDSGSLRLSSMLTLLRRAGHGITMLSTSADRQAPYAEDIGAQGITVVCGEAAGLDHLARHGRAYRTVLLVRPETALAWLFPVRVHAPNARVIYDTVDLHWVRMSRAATLSGDVALLDRAEHYRRVERFAAKAADFTLTVTDVEREALVELDPTLSVEVLPNIHAIEPLPGKWEERSGLVFIGGFFHEPNVDAVRHFAADILPIVHRRLPGLTFTIVGSDMPDEITSLQSTTVKPIGFVGDPRPHFEMARMLVAPLRYGAGMKGKIGHAMSHGLPVVTTTIGAEGMGLVHGDTALIADTPEAFAEAVVRLYSERQLWERLAARGLAHVEAVFSERAALRRLEALFPAITAADLTR